MAFCQALVGLSVDKGIPHRTCADAPHVAKRGHFLYLSRRGALHLDPCVVVRFHGGHLARGSIALRQPCLGAASVADTIDAPTSIDADRHLATYAENVIYAIAQPFCAKYRTVFS